MYHIKICIKHLIEIEEAVVEVHDSLFTFLAYSDSADALGKFLAINMQFASGIQSSISS